MPDPSDCLERSCDSYQFSCLSHQGGEVGVSVARGTLFHRGFDRHRHDTYTLSLTLHGVQQFAYRGATYSSLPGQLVVLHPDEAHDGRPGSGEAMSFQSLYFSPALISDAARSIGVNSPSLPFVSTHVFDAPALASTMRRAIGLQGEDLWFDEVTAETAQTLVGIASGSAGVRSRSRRLRLPVLDRVAEFLRENSSRVVRSPELEALSSMSRFELTVQFKQRFGTSPHRFLVMRRLDRAASLILRGDPLSLVATAVGFADQAHMSRAFKATFGLTPRRFARLGVAGSTEKLAPAQSRSRAHPPGVVAGGKHVDPMTYVERNSYSEEVNG